MRQADAVNVLRSHGLAGHPISACILDTFPIVGRRDKAALGHDFALDAKSARMHLALD